MDASSLSIMIPLFHLTLKTQPPTKNTTSNKLEFLSKKIDNTAFLIKKKNSEVKKRNSLFKSILTLFGAVMLRFKGQLHISHHIQIVSEYAL